MFWEELIFKEMLNRFS